MNTKSFQAYKEDTKNVLEFYDTSLKGLNESSALERYGVVGPNAITEDSRNKFFKIVLKQFKGLMIYILLIAAFISIILKQHIDAYVILGVIFLNAVIGFLHEYRVERSITALKKMASPRATVTREGINKRIKSAYLVPGDIVHLQEGDRIPADGRLIESMNLTVVESSLTGESEPIQKNTIKIPVDTIEADRKNMVWSGTFVVSGKGKFIVTKTGKDTFFGRIAESLKSIEKKPDHFSIKTKILAKNTAILAIVISSLIFIVGLFFRNLSFTEIFLFSIASLVSIIPEGLIAVLSIILAIGARRMTKRKAITKNLSAIETLGATTTIVTDKTGTLTQNIMMVEKIETADGDIFNISGNGWENEGDFVKDGEKINTSDYKNLEGLLKVVTVCNDAGFEDKEGKINVLGEPTEAALIVVANKAGLTQDKILQNEFKIDEPGFNSEKKYRETLVETKDGKKFLYIVGAPESVIDACSHSGDFGQKTLLKKEKVSEIKESVISMANKSLRTLSVAIKEVPQNSYRVSELGVNKMIYLGTLGMKDPVKRGVKEAIEKTKEAGIRVIMATGDHKATAIAIAEEIGLIENREEMVAITGEEIGNLSKEDFEKAVLEKNIFARVNPDIKMRIAKILQDKGEIVAMTGDGVNDAPALRQADVGISMGLVGTDVARESSEIILADDNFETIVNAIEEGRLVYGNVRKAGSFLISTNLAEGFTILTTIAIGLPLPLLPTQILWLNLVTDSFAGLPLASEPAHSDLLKEKPDKYKEDIISRETLPFMILMVFVMVTATIFVFKKYLPDGIEKARTMAFTVIAFSQLFNVLNLRSLKKSVFEIKLFSNKSMLVGLGFAILAQLVVTYSNKLNHIFYFIPISAKELFIAVGLSAFVIVFGEIYKIIKNKIL